MSEYKPLTSIALPLQVTVDGNLAVATDGEVVEQAILSILQTQPFERVMQPKMGIRDLTFVAMTNPVLIIEYITQALETQLSYVNFSIQGSAANDDGSLAVQINYSYAKIPQSTMNLTLTP